MDNKISALIQEFATNHAEEISQPFKVTKNAEILTKQLPSTLVQTLGLEERFKVKGSVGNGNWSEIPWLAILDTDITSSTTQGYYFVLLFDKDLRTFHMSLGVGYTQFEREFGVIDAKNRIEVISAHYTKLLKGLSANLSSGPINLHANNNLGKGYELGTIASKQYSIDDLSDTQLIQDIQVLLASYAELKSIVGNSILNLTIDPNEYNDEVKSFKKEILKKSLDNDIGQSIIDLIGIADQAPPAIRQVLKSQIVRIKKNADFVKDRASYICEICTREPFIQKNGKPYAEADHIVPLGGSTRGIDHPDNMRCLCSQCHAVVTHGSDEEVKKLLS